MDRTSTTTKGYDIWNEEVPKPKNFSTSTNGGRHFKPQINNQTPTNEERHFKPQVNSQTPTNRWRHFKPQFSDPTSINGGRHFKPQDTNPNDPTKFAHITRRGGGGGRHFKPLHLEIDNLVEALNKSTQQTQANISLWGLLMASYKHRQNLVDFLNQIQVPTTTTSQDLNAMIGSIIGNSLFPILIRI